MTTTRKERNRPEVGEELKIITLVRELRHYEAILSEIFTTNNISRLKEARTIKGQIKILRESLAEEGKSLQAEEIKVSFQD